MSTRPVQDEQLTLVIGIGNFYRGDDALGIVVARRLKARNPDHITIVEQSGEGAALMAAWQHASSVIVVDAMKSGAQPGSIQRFDAHTEPLPSRIFPKSTHAFSLVEAIELARVLGQLPQQLIVYAVEGKNIAPGEGLSAEVEQAADELERLLAGPQVIVA